MSLSVFLGWPLSRVLEALRGQGTVPQILVTRAGEDRCGSDRTLRVAAVRDKTLVAAFFRDAMPGLEETD